MGGERHSPLQWPQARGGSPGYNFLLSLHPWQSKTVKCVCVYERVCVCVLHAYTYLYALTGRFLCNDQKLQKQLGVKGEVGVVILLVILQHNIICIYLYVVCSIYFNRVLLCSHRLQSMCRCMVTL